MEYKPKKNNLISFCGIDSAILIPKNAKAPKISIIKTIPFTIILYIKTYYLSRYFFFRFTKKKLNL